MFLGSHTAWVAGRKTLELKVFEKLPPKSVAEHSTNRCRNISRKAGEKTGRTHQWIYILWGEIESVFNLRRANKN